MKKSKKVVNCIFSILILGLFIVALILCIIGRFINIFGMCMSYLLDEDYVPKWADTFYNKLAYIYDEYINLTSSL